jgi:hypothetical protein
MGKVIRYSLVMIAIFLGIIAFELWPGHPDRVYADSGRFDYVQVIATSFLYKGAQGVLILDKRNGNLWFIAKGQDMDKAWFDDPVFVMKTPLEKLDQAAPQ